MRRSLIFLVATSGAVAASGCGGSTTPHPTAAPDTKARPSTASPVSRPPKTMFHTTASPPTTTPPSPAIRTTPVTSGIGKTFPLTDPDGATFNATLLKVVDPGTAAPYYPTAPGGDRYVGIELRVTDTSKTITVDQEVSAGVTIVDSADTKVNFNPTELSNCPSFSVPDTAQPTPGTSQTGCVAYAVPNGQQVVSVVYAPEDLPGTPTARWHLRILAPKRQPHDHR